VLPVAWVRPQAAEAGIGVLQAARQKLRLPEEYQSRKLRLQHFARNNEGEKFQNSHEVMGETISDQFHADDQQQDAVDELVECLGTLPIHTHQCRDTFVGKGRNAEEDPQRQYAFEHCREQICIKNYTSLHERGA
jgi:hypothetical protein